MTVFHHTCIRVLDLARSQDFYQKALGFTAQKEMTIHGGAWRLVFLGDGVTGNQLELCQVEGREQPYDLGDAGVHIGIVTDDFEALKAKHAAMGLITEEDAGLGIYFLQDPDGHDIEIVPKGN